MGSLPPVKLPVVAHDRVWRWLQWTAMAGLAAVLVGLRLAPDRVLPFFWGGVLPVLPLLFLVHPGLWRNVCPLATLSLGGDQRPGAPPRATIGLGVVLLLLVIPLRPAGVEGSATASTVLLLGAGVAAVTGRRRARKSGFCNTWCPVLPVERLYGQHPLVGVGNARCSECSVCTPRACPDLSPGAATAQLLGRRRHGQGWLFTAFGAFAAAFPGVVLAFFTLPEAPGAAGAYLAVALGAGSSWLATSVVVRSLKLDWRVALTGLAGIAAGLYAGLALPGVAESWGVPEAGRALQALGVGLVAAWWIRAHSAASREPLQKRSRSVWK